jgi:polysaccharide pyruvyl transferase WcaK-like protein
MRKRIGIIGLTSNQNIGDYLLVEATKSLVTNLSEHDILLEIDIDPRAVSYYRGRTALYRKIYNRMLKLEPAVFRVVRSQHLRYLYQYLYWYVKLNWHFKRTIKDLDGLIFSGGGFIKFRTQGLNYLDEQILKIAQKRNIPVMMSAVGIEHYDDNDLRCRRLKKALNLPVVKIITTRDDIQTLDDSYLIRKDIVTSQVADPVLLLREVREDYTSEATKLIGINLVNPNNFVNYGGKLSRLSVINFYRNLITELQLKNEEFLLFTNGMPTDMNLGRRLLSDLNLPSSYLLPAPKTSAEFIADLKKFDIILAARMHAGITACSLEIPFLGLNWGVKIGYFSHVAGISENYFDENQLDPVKVSQLLMDRNVHPVDRAAVAAYGEKTKQYLSDFVRSLGAHDVL